MKYFHGSSLSSYQEPTQVPLDEKSKAFGNNGREGTRPNSSVSSVEGVPVPGGNRSQWQGDPDCLPKTQAAASSKGCV